MGLKEQRVGDSEAFSPPGAEDGDLHNVGALADIVETVDTDVIPMNTPSPFSFTYLLEEGVNATG